MEKPHYEKPELAQLNDPDILRIQKTMDRTEGINQDQDRVKEIKKEFIYYDNPNDFLTAFERSDIFDQILQNRTKLLMRERPDIELNHEMLVEGTRMSESYRDGIIDFYKSGNRMNGDLSVYPEPARTSIKEYLRYVQKSRSALDSSKLLSRDRSDINLGKGTERYRDGLHNEAANYLMNGRISLGDGTSISADDKDESATQILDPLVFLHIGRRLVHLIAVDKGIDQLDVDRERNKINSARLKYGFGAKIED